jgi:hypothetical protein
MLSEMFSRLARSLLILLLFNSIVISIVSAQSPPAKTSSKSAEEKKAREEREKKALTLVDEIITETESLTLPDNRIRVDLALADSLWPRDEKRARLLFKQAVASLGEITAAAAVVDAPNRDYLAQISQQLRQEILQIAAKHDAGLALDFLKATRPSSHQQQPYWQPNFEAQLEMQLATQVVAKDPKEALSIAEESLKLGLGQDPTNLLYSLNSQDKAAGETFLNDILNQLRSGESSKSPAAPYIALSLLRNWIESNRAASGQSGERPPSGMSPTNLNADVARELSAMIINAVMNGGSSNSVGIFTGMIVDGEGGLSQFYPGQLVGIIQQLKPMLPDIEKLAPAQFSVFSNKFTELEKLNESQQGPWAKYQQLSQNGSAEELMQAAKTAPPGVSEALLRQAAWKAIGQGDVDAAHQIVEKITDPRQRAEMELNMTRRSFERAQSEKKIAMARSLLSRLPAEERIALLAQMATSVASDGNSAMAVDLLNEAEGLLGYRALNYQQLEAELQISTAYEQLNLSKSAALVEKAINQLNELAVAALVLNGFDLQQYFRDGELVISGGNQLSQTAQESAQRLGSLSRHDFDRAKSIAEEFQRPEMRIMSLLQIAQSSLTTEDR